MVQNCHNDILEGLAIANPKELEELAQVDFISF
jgi:hypothetical protein